VEVLADFLTSIDLYEVGPSIRLLLGRPLPEMESWSMEVGYAIIEKVKEGKQRTLFGEEPGIEEVLSGLRRVAEVSGAGSRRNKENLLQNLFGRLSETGREYLKRSLCGELRIGVSEGVMLEALSRASGRPLEEIRRVNMIRWRPGGDGPRRHERGSAAVTSPTLHSHSSHAGGVGGIGGRGP